MAEVWGKVNDNECNRIKRAFDKNESQGNNDLIVFRDMNDPIDDDDQNVTTSTNNSMMDQTNTVSPTVGEGSDLPKRTIIFEDQEFNIDDI